MPGNRSKLAHADVTAMTSEEFDDILLDLLDDLGPADLVGVPGVYEAVSEFLNNDVIDTWKKRRAEEDSDDSADDAEDDDNGP